MIQASVLQFVSRAAPIHGLRIDCNASGADSLQALRGVKCGSVDDTTAWEKFMDEIFGDEFHEEAEGCFPVLCPTCMCCLPQCQLRESKKSGSSWWPCIIISLLGGIVMLVVL